MVPNAWHALKCRHGVWSCSINFEAPAGPASFIMAMTASQAFNSIGKSPRELLLLLFWSCKAASERDGEKGNEQHSTHRGCGEPFQTHGMHDCGACHNCATCLLVVWSAISAMQCSVRLSGFVSRSQAWSSCHAACRKTGTNRLVARRRTRTAGWCIIAASEWFGRSLCVSRILSSCLVGCVSAVVCTWHLSCRVGHARVLVAPRIGSC